MKRYLVLLASLLVVSPLLSAEATESYGVAAGSTSGYGFSYRNWPGPWGLQITGIPIFSGTSSLVSLGANALYTVHETQWTKLYGYGGGAFLTAGVGGSDSRSVSAGVGFGLELIVGGHLTFDLEFGLGAQTGLLAGWGYSAQYGLFYRL